MEKLRILLLDDEASDTAVFTEVAKVLQQFSAVLDVRHLRTNEDVLMNIGSHPHIAAVNAAANTAHTQGKFTHQQLARSPFYYALQLQETMGTRVIMCAPGYDDSRLDRLRALAGNMFPCLCAIANVTAAILFHARRICPDAGIPKEWPPPPTPLLKEESPHPLASIEGTMSPHIRSQFEHFLAGKDASRSSTIHSTY
jgi:hypothetical protein